MIIIRTFQLHSEEAEDTERALPAIKWETVVKVAIRSDQVWRRTGLKLSQLCKLANEWAADRDEVGLSVVDLKM